LRDITLLSNEFEVNSPAATNEARGAKTLDFTQAVKPIRVYENIIIFFRLSYMSGDSWQ